MRNGIPIFLTLILYTSILQADFSASQVSLHPRYPANGPFIVEVSGTWPSDCHPGEQKPVINAYDGETLEIGFEIIVVHITCNDHDTGYRALLDLSQAVRDLAPSGESLTVSVNFEGATFEQTVDLVCMAGDECPESSAQRLVPERGLYVNSERASEGLLVARQDDAMAVYPLVYGPDSSAEWLFSVGRVSGNGYFADLYRFYDGNCFLCEPEGTQPAMENVGYITILTDRPGLLQVKVNDRLFAAYHKLVYGYEVFPPAPAGAPALIGMQGRWALSENEGTDPPLGDLTNFLPPAFDIVFDTVVPDPQAGLAGGQVYYMVTTVTGGELGQLVCQGKTGVDGARPLCEFIDPTDAAEPLLLFFQDGPSSLSIEYGRAVIAVGTPPGGKAVRLD